MIAVCVKRVDLRPEIDPVTGAVRPGAQRPGWSDADRSALEVGLRLAEERGTNVALLCAAPADADDQLRELAAAGAARVVRVDVVDVAPSSTVGRSLAAAIDDLGEVDLVLCGAMSLDRGSGAVPAFVAHHLGWAQALGLVEIDASGGELVAVRRLDGGRRERLRVPSRTVVSVEGAVATLRRAPLPAVLSAARTPVEVHAGAADPTPVHESVRSRPIMPRTRVVPAPAGTTALDRVVELTGALVERTPPRHVVAEPAEAADVIVEQLRAWGYLDEA